jgi:hypothetical protein
MMEVVRGCRPREMKIKDLKSFCTHQSKEYCTLNGFCEYQKLQPDLSILCGLEGEALALAEEPVMPEDLECGGQLK